MLTRRALVASAALAPVAAQGQTAWPDRPVRIIVAFPGGSTPDLAARTLVNHYQQAFGQPFVVDNRAGGGGNIGTEAIARATDGHTIGVTIGGPGSTAKVLNPNLGFDPATDLAPISLLARLPFVFVASCDLPLFDGEVPSKLLGLLGESDAVIPKIGERAQPLCGLYRSRAFGALRTSDSPRIMDWVQTLEVVYADEDALVQVGIAPDSISSANTPEELQRLLRGGAQTKPLS